MGRELALVSGATGFIGRRLVQALAGEGYRVRALVRAPERADLREAEAFRGDLLDPSSLDGVERDVAVAFHCASMLGKWGTPDDLLRRLNVDGARSLLERFRGSTTLTRYVHLSAGGVTGPLPEGPVDETYACRPATGYERTKLEGEQQVLERSHEWQIPALVLRPTFTYGPGDPHKAALFRAVQRRRYVYISGGHSVNHPVYIDDLIRGLLLGMHRGKAGEVYIVGGERPVSKRELVEAIADTLGVSRPRLSIPRWAATAGAVVFEAMGRAAGFEPILTRSRVMMMADDFGYKIDKARRELGYEPRVSLREGIEATVADFRKRGVL